MKKLFDLLLSIILALVLIALFVAILILSLMFSWIIIPFFGLVAITYIIGVATYQSRQE
jgi:uncharacterized membrane protein